MLWKTFILPLTLRLRRRLDNSALAETFFFIKGHISESFTLVVQGNLHRTNREPRKAAEILNAQVNATLMYAQDPEKRCPDGLRCPVTSTRSNKQ